MTSHICEVKSTEDTVLSEVKNDCIHEPKHHDRIYNVVEDLSNNVIVWISENFESKFEISPSKEMSSMIQPTSHINYQWRKLITV